MASRSTEPTVLQQCTGFAGSLLWYLSSLMPSRFRWVAGGTIGTILYYLHGERRRITQCNLELCFPEKSKSQCAQIALQSFQFAGRGVLSWGFAMFASDKRIRREVTWHGEETLNNYLKTKKSLILLCPHFVSPMLTLRSVGLLSPAVSMYKPPVNPIFDMGYHCALSGKKSKYRWLNWIYRKRSHNHIDMVSSSGKMLPFYRALKQGIPFFYLPDQNAKREAHRVFTPFFNVPAATYTSLTRFGQYTSARIFLCFSIMKPSAKGYELYTEQLAEDFITGDAEQDARRLNKTIETLVRRVPEQYFWLHRRFKTRPPGEPSVYPD